MRLIEDKIGLYSLMNKRYGGLIDIFSTGQEKKDFVLELLKIYTNAKKNVLSNANNKFKILPNKKRTLQQLADLNIFYSKDVSAIDAILGESRIYYDKVSVENDKLSFEGWAGKFILTSKFTKTIGVYEPICLNIYGNQTLVVPAFVFGLTLKNQDDRHYQQALNTALLIGGGYNLANGGGFWSMVDVGLGAGGLVIDKYRTQLEKTAKGKTFIAFYEAANILVAGYAIGKGIIGLTKAIKDLRAARQALASENPALADDIAKEVDDLAKKGEEILETVGELTSQVVGDGKKYYLRGVEVGSTGISKSGYIAFDIKIPTDLQKQGFATQIVDDAIMFYKNQNKTINGIQGRWLSSNSYEGGMSTNLKSFIDDYLHNGKTFEASALNTPTGKIASKNGFTKVIRDDWEILDLGGSKPAEIYWVELKFKKP